MNKNEIRKVIKEKRNEMSGEEVVNKSHEIFNKFLTYDIKNFEKFFVYNSIKNEVQTQEIICYLLKNKKTVFMPRVEGKNMVAVRIDKNTIFKRSKFGILEPENEACMMDNFVAIIPCVAVDKTGNRIGYGGGYYDRFLENKNAIKIAVCFSNQIVDCIPNEKFDIKMDVIISDKELINLNEKGLNNMTETECCN